MENRLFLLEEPAEPTNVFTGGTRIILNKQSDGKLTDAEILRPIGIEKSDLPGLVQDLQNLEQAIDNEKNRAIAKDAEHDEAIANEITRAEAKDAEHDEAIANEITRAKDAEGSLEEKIDADVSAEESARISGDASLEAKIDADVSAEESARVSGDASLEAKVSTEKSRIDAILEASDADKDSFAEIVTLINSVDTENDQAFASYVLSNDAALSTEVSSRISGDASLEGKVNADISTEVSSRISGDASLEAEINAEVADLNKALAEETTARQATVSAEESARIAADASIESYFQEEIDELEQGRVANAINISSEESARIAADGSLEDKIDEEISRAINKETDLQNELNAEVTRATAKDAEHDAAIESEVSSRLSADASLNEKIELESKDLNESISSEEAARIAADTSLDTALAAEISRATEAEDSIATVLSSEVSSIIANTDLNSIDSFAEVVSELDAEESVRLAGDTSLEAEIDALPLTDDVTIEVDGENNIRLKDTVAEGTAGVRTFEGLNNASVQPDTLSGYTSLSYITKGILDAFDTSVTGDVSAEASIRAAADASLEAKIDADVSAEESARVSGDASLEAKVSTEKSRIDAILEASDADKDSFAEIVTLINSVDTENDQAFASYVLSNDAALSTEVAARIAQGLDLQNDMEIGFEALESADASLEAKVNADISTEVAARESADLAEQNARIAGDAAVTAAFEAADSVERAARIAADASLEVVLSAEISAQNSIDQAIKDGVNGALVEVKDMVMNAIQGGAFRSIASFEGDGTTVEFGAMMKDGGAIYLNGLLQVADVDYTFSSSIDGKGNLVSTFTFNDAPEVGASVMIYGQPGYVVNSDWFGDITPVVLGGQNLA